MKYRLSISDWGKNRQALSQVRRNVFIEEQSVPEELEWDQDDANATHILVTDENKKPIATGRIKADGHIGRMAVLKAHRHTGIGSSILQALIHIAKNKKLEKVYLHAQTSAIVFYEKQNFEIISGEFMDAGIPHKTMQLILN